MAAYGRPGVYVNERLLPAPIAVIGTADAAGACIGQFAQGPETPTLVTSWYDFVKKFGGYSNSYPATLGVGLFFTNGGSELYVKRILASDAEASEVDITATVGETALGEVFAKNRGIDGDLLRVQFTATGRAGYYNFTVYKEGSTNASDSNDSNDIVLEQFNDVIISDPLSSDYVETIVNMNSQYVTMTLNQTAITTANPDLVPVLTRLALSGGDNGTAPGVSDYVNALDDFTAADRPFVLFAPEIWQDLVSTSVDDVHAGMVSWAASNNSFAVLDTLPALLDNGSPGLTVDDALDYANTSGITGYSHAAVYYPNIYITDPLGRSSSSLRKVGPAGAVAGMYIYTDKQTGPFKAPAGLRATLRGAVALEKQLTPSELDQLNSGTKDSGTVVAPVNAIRNIPGAGVVVMGARTLLQDGTANKYVNMRRSLIYLRKSLEDLSEFALFENNDERLWARIRATLGVFLNNYRNLGGLRGETADQAFYVKCDAETNPIDSIANGEVHIEVGVALQYPAEFVVINLSQKTAI